MSFGQKNVRQNTEGINDKERTSMGKNILVIDDDIELCKLLKQCLGNEGFKVDCLYDGKKVIQFIENNQTDMVILDVMLPETDGFAVLSKIRKISDVPVLMLSAKSDEMNKVLGLRIGADDYITKPFGLSELIARVDNLFKRCSSSNKKGNRSTVISCGKLCIDTNKCIVTKAEKSIQLTSKEYKLLCFLAKNPGTVFTKKQIYSNVWEEDFMYDDNTIMALISRLRKKVEDSTDGIEYIQTVRGIGYRFTDCENHSK